MTNKHIIMTIAILFSCTTGKCQQLKLEFNFSNARQTIRYMQSPSAGTKEINGLLQLPSTKGLLKKIKMDSLSAVNALLNVHDTSKYNSTYQKFQYRGIKRNLPELTAFVALIESKQDSIKHEVLKALNKYMPSGKEMSIKVYFLLGGTSSGFTLGDDSVFYIGTHQYKNDLTSIIESCKHELFHNIQRLHLNAYTMTAALDKEDHGLAYVHYMLINLFMEGSAEYVADLRKVNNPHALSVKDLLEHAQVNDYRSEQVFYLVSKLLTEVNDHPGKAEQGNLYNILFDWNWNNPGYYAGYIMTKALCQEYGEDVLLKYLKQDPSFFVYDYIQLTRQKKDKYLLRFTDDFEKVIVSLAEKVKVSN